jgi:hypothetical protein
MKQILHNFTQNSIFVKNYILVSLLFLFGLNSYSQNNWDGDNAAGNFSYCNNWYGSIDGGSCPLTWNRTTDLLFQYRNSVSQTSLYLDLGWKEVHDFIFSSTYGQSTPLTGVIGNGFDIFGKLENNSSYKQTIGVPTSFKGPDVQINAVNADMDINSTVYNDGNLNINIYGPNSKLLTFNNYIVGSTASMNIDEYSKVAIAYDMTNRSPAAFGGGVNINTGELWINSGGKLNGGTISLGADNVVSKLYINAIDGTQVSNTIVVRNHAGSTQIVGSFSTSGTNEYTGTVTLNQAVIFETANGGITKFTGVISGANNVTINNITGSGTATIVYNSATTNTYSGTTTINSGANLKISTNQTIGNLVLSSGGTLTVDAGVTLTITGTTSIGGSINNLGTIILQGSATQNFPGSSTTISAMNNLIINNSNGVTIDKAFTISGTLSMPSGVATMNESVTAANLTLGVLGTQNTTWGSTSSAAIIKNNTYFASTGIVAVTNDTSLTPIVTVTPTGTTYTYNSSAQGPSTATNTGTGSNYTYSYLGVSGTSYSASVTAPTNTGSYTVIATVGASADGFYKEASSSATPFTIGASTYIPDENFEQALIGLLLDSGPLDHYVLTANISGVIFLDVSSKSIADLTGIAAFTNLYELICKNNLLTSLDVSALPALRNLGMLGNKLVNASDLKAHPNLTYLDCDDNLFTSIDVSGLTNLVDFYCSGNQLASLDVRGLTSLAYFECTNNPLTCIAVDNVLAANNKAAGMEILPSTDPKSYYLWVKDGTAFYSESACPTTWDGDTWDHGVPTASNEAIIDGDYSTTTNGGFTAEKLTVHSGKSLTINTATNVTVIGITTNAGIINNEGTITNTGTIKNTSTALQTGYLLSATSIANVTQERYLTSNQRGWRLLSNPLTTTTFGTLASGSTTPFTLGNNSSGAYDSVSNTWSNGVDADNMVSQQGYKVFIRGISSEVTGLTYSVGTPSNVTVSITGAATNAVPAPITTVAGQYYLVANPYTAPVSVASILGASFGLSGSASYYDPTNASAAGVKVKAGGYDVISVSGVAGSANDVVLPPMGAIFVQASSAGTVNIPKTAIFTGTVLGGNYNHKTANTQNVTPIALTVNVSSNGVDYDKLQLRFKETGTAGSNIDFGKMANTILDFYSIDRASKNMAVSELELAAQTIPLGINSTALQSFRFTIAENSIPADFEAVLEDKLLNTQTVLTTGTNYDFSIDANAASQGIARFAITLKTTSPLSVKDNTLDAKIVIWPNPAHNQFYIKNNQVEGDTTFKIYSLTGQLIHSDKAVPGATTTLNANGWASGHYIMEASHNGAKTTKQLIIQ